MTKLFNVVRPTRAYFGRKDVVQCALVRRLAVDLGTSVEVRIGETVREENGLAMSSRNQNLSDGGKHRAGVIFRALSKANHLWEGREGRIDAAVLKKVVEDTLMGTVDSIEYISVDHVDTLREVHDVGEEGAVISVAVILEGVRLIDNILLDMHDI